MLQFIAFTIIYGIMMFIWSFVYLNRSNDKINQAFLAFMSVIVLWIILSVSNNYQDTTILGLVLKTIYWYSMLSMSVFFLLFVYRLIKKELDAVFYLIAIVNTLTIFSRYLFPLDYSDPTFWRLSVPVVAPLMSTIFSIPAIYGLFLLIRQYIAATDERQKKQLRYIYFGISIALTISVISEYILPTLLHINMELSLMYLAILVFVLSVFISIMKHRLFNIQFEYIYKKLLMNAHEGIIIVRKNSRIMCVNDAAKEILKNESISPGDKITDYIKEYVFETDYKQHEVQIKQQGQERYLTIAQNPIEPTDKNSAKLMTLTDITLARLKLEQEKDMLIKKSSIDQLTGLYSKQYLYDVLYADTADLGEMTLTILFIDVDDFKYINDLYGHMVGDIVLKTVAACIKDNVGSDAQAIRFGGDEFVVVFINEALAQVYLLAEKIRTEANALRFPELDTGLGISLSIGLAQGPPPLQELIAKADMAMYCSKGSGKNRTTMLTECSSETLVLH